MATEFMIMPLSRYVSGDFVTTSMKSAWEQGIPCVIFPRGVRRELPPGLPFGGADASARRERFLPTLQEALTHLPATMGHQLWDERSQVEPRFHRVDPASYASLVDQAQKKRDAPSLWDLLRRRAATPLHVTATLFLPNDFGAVFAMTSPLGRNTGSAPRALRELSSMAWSTEAGSAKETLTKALRDARELRLPMIVDA